MITTPDDVLLALGYGRTIPEYALDRLDDISYYLGQRIDSIMASLVTIDEALQSAPLDSMAVKVDKLEVSYSQHLVLLKQEASRLLAELSQLVEIPIAYDKYSRKSPGSRTTRPAYNFVSYW